MNNTWKKENIELKNCSSMIHLYVAWFQNFTFPCESKLQRLPIINKCSLTLGIIKNTDQASVADCK